jgi:hypothetical protein
MRSTAVTRANLFWCVTIIGRSQHLMRQLASTLALAVVASLPIALPAQIFNAGLVGTCNVGGNCGTSGADGVVGLSGLDGSTAYGYVTTLRSSTTSASNGVGYAELSSSNRLGSLWSYSFSTTMPATTLGFRFNYVSRDGGLFPDYAFAHLFNTATNERTILFNARTQTSGDIIPGQGLPAPSPGVTLIPGSSGIIAGAPNWSVLGNDETSTQALGINCWAAGCGYTDWITSLFTIASVGSYRLELGVVNAEDNGFQSGLAFDFALSGGVPVAPSVPEPTAAVLLLAGLSGLGIVSRRRRV